MTRESLAAELSRLAPPLLERLARRGFRAAQLCDWAATVGGDVGLRNRLPGRVDGVPDGVVKDLAEDAALAALGRQALRSGEVAVCILAGGMATRMGGVVKALVEALPGKTFLDLRLDEIRRLGAEGSSVPIWFLTSEPTDGPIRAALARQAGGLQAEAFEQFVSLRLDTDGGLFLQEGEPSVYATGHGDLPDALKQSGLLDAFVARGGRTVWISNLDNVGAAVDPLVLGHHLASGAALTAEVVDKRPGDTGGGPVLHDGRPIIAENFRLPPDFDAARVSVFNTNTFLVDARALAGLTLDWTYVEVRKSVGGTTAVQFERLLGEITTALDTQFLRVPRDGLGSRFLPVKSFDDLAAVGPLLEARASRTS